MKKHIIQFFASAILSASAFAYYEPTGTCLTWFGYNALDMASGDYSAFFGSYSGKYGSTLDYSSFVGVMSGAYASNLKSCNAIGYYAMSSAYDSDYIMAFGPHAGQDSYYNRDCVFIGRNAGREVYNCTNCVFIGNNAGRVLLNNMCDYTSINGNIYSLGKKFWIGVAEGAPYDTAPVFFDGSSLTVLRSEIHELIIGPQSKIVLPDRGIMIVQENSTIKLDNGNNMTISGKSIDGYIGDTDFKSISITDEDTGEKYIIKVKSGALKLYKVEETNAANGPANNAPNGNGETDEQE